MRSHAKSQSTPVNYIVLYRRDMSLSTALHSLVWIDTHTSDVLSLPMPVQWYIIHKDHCTDIVCDSTSQVHHMWASIQINGYSTALNDKYIFLTTIIVQPFLTDGYLIYFVLVYISAVT